MLYNRKLKLIIWTPYKNYSTTIRMYLLNKPNMLWEEYIGYIFPHTGLCNDHGHAVHTNQYPPFLSPSYLTKFKKILPIRNPYERVISQWKYHCRHYNKTECFHDWFWREAKLYWEMPVANQYEYDILLKVENIEEEFKNLDLHLSYPLPKLNVSSNELEHTLTQEEKDLIYFLHYEDFVAGGYEK